ncbi:MAG: T9SS type A sorting domain-containing protein [Chitinophagales bacterium]|nr:T9SS type A sorting domain-containing protein [Chitinophagales bacterium]
MRPFFTFILFALFGQLVNAQTCSTTFTVDSASLTPASNYPTGGFSPRPLPPITQGVFYEQDVTFVMPKEYDTGIIGVVDIDQIQVSSVTNLPPGITWSCNIPGCTYYPQTSQYGSVKICGTTLAAPKVDSVKITVIGSAVGQQLPISFYLPYEIIANPVSSGSFTVDNVTGCDSVTATFAATIGGQGNPITYDWNFGNGNTSADSVPPTQTYTAPGAYDVTLETVISNYVLTSVTVNAVNDNWEEFPGVECNDQDPFLGIPLCVNTAPDIFIQVYDNSNNLVFTSSSVTDQNTPVNFNNINSGNGVVLSSGPYIIRVWDEDFTGNPNDDLGSFTVSNFNLGTNTRSGSGTTITFTIGTTPLITYNDTVTINVYPSPSQPSITNISGDTSICSGDTVVLMSTSGDSYTWYQNGNEITGANDDSLLVTASGNYAVRVVSQYACSSPISASDSIFVSGFPPLPNISYDAVNDRLSSNNAGGFQIQWYLNGSPINGANATSYADPDTGTYTLELTNQYGCSRFSDEFLLSATSGIASLNAKPSIELAPNPNKGTFNLHIQGIQAQLLTISIHDLMGKEVFVTQLNGAGKSTFNLPIQLDIASGIYLVSLQTDQYIITKKLLID